MALVENRKRKSPENDNEEDGEIIDEETPTKIIKINENDMDSNLKDKSIDDKSNIIENNSNNTTDLSEVDSAQLPINSVEITDNSPCITITFKNDTVSQHYKAKFLKFVNNFIELQSKSEDNLIKIYQDSSFNPDEWIVVDEDLQGCLTETSPPSHSKKRKKESKAKKELFVVDSNPSPNASGHDTKYISKFTISLEKSETEEAAVSTSKMSCFNCDQFHALKDCPQPKDYDKINATRQRMRSQNNQKSTRYHLEEEQKYSHLTPGKISNELRNALGLHKSQLPHFIYKMRKLGYPPGWLEEAKITYSDLDMFVDGKNLKSNGVKKGGLDPSKVIDYPGFNVAPDKGIRDEYKSYGVPPYSEMFSKEAMLKFFNEKFASSTEDDMETTDMDVDSSDETKLTKSSEVKTETLQTRSIDELEKEKLQLLEELNKEEKDEKVEEKDKEKVETGDDPDDKINNSEEDAEEEEEENCVNELNDNNTSITNISIVKTSSYGTPILKSSSPYDKLPHPDKFSKDVSPVINFENLPNSTGKYEQMVDVLQKVRKTMKNLQNCST